jgi:hypothetical protein
MNRQSMNRQSMLLLLLRRTLGANLLTNGTFETNTTGWSAVNTPTTFESLNAQAHIVATGTGKGFGQSLTLVSGKRYRVDYDYSVVTGAFTVSKVGMPSQSAQTGTGHKTFTFTETDGTARTFLIQSAGAGSHEFYLDNIRVRRFL